MKAAAPKAPNKHQARTQETYNRLINAAEQVFVRDGYEGAQLSEIAKAAGRTKGAVYANFKSKEDLFLALFEHRTRENIDRLMQKLEGCRSQKQRFEALRAFCIDLVSDKTWPILTLEFKLFALRHAESKARLRKAFEMSKSALNRFTPEQLVGPSHSKKSREFELGGLALGPIVSALVLESFFEPERLSEKGLRYLLGRVFDALYVLPD
jgi:AcrR family transcriptional regulator